MHNIVVCLVRARVRETVRVRKKDDTHVVGGRIPASRNSHGEKDLNRLSLPIMSRSTASLFLRLGVPSGSSGIGKNFIIADGGTGQGQSPNSLSNTLYT